MRGYDPVEVDEFLDNIIKDYESYNKEILALQEENDRLNAKSINFLRTKRLHHGSNKKRQKVKQ